MRLFLMVLLQRGLACVLADKYENHVRHIIKVIVVAIIVSINYDLHNANKGSGIWCDSLFALPWTTRYLTGEVSSSPWPY